MALNYYQQQTQLLLNDPSQQQYNVSDIASWINVARGQIAASTQCLRYTGSLAVTSGSNTYPISEITGAPLGVQNALSVRMLSRVIVGAGRSFLELRPWEWAFLYWFSNPNPSPGPPKGWSIQQPGPFAQIYLNPVPDQAYTLNADCVGLPISLETDSDLEAIPYPWTDAIPYFAAYLAYLNSQREQDAEQMISKWAQFTSWGTKQSTPSVMSDYYPGGRGAMGAAERILNTGLGAPQQPAGRRAG